MSSFDIILGTRNSNFEDLIMKGLNLVSISIIIVSSRLMPTVVRKYPSGVAAGVLFRCACRDAIRGSEGVRHDVLVVMQYEVVRVLNTQ